MNSADRQIIACEIGHLIRKARRRADLSVSELAARLDVSRQWLTRVEMGQTAPSLARLVQIADALDAPPSALLPPADPET